MTRPQTRGAGFDLPQLGVGLGFRPPLLPDVFRYRSEIDFLEITPDHYFDAPAEKLEELALLRQHFVLVPHALDTSLGGADGVREDYLDRLADFVNAVDAPWWTEHAAFTQWGERALGHLAPLPFNDEAVDRVSRNVDRVRARVDRPLLLENISYPFRVPGSTFGEAEFLTRLLEATGCGLLLDVTNLYVNATNLRYDPLEFLEQIPLERVHQLHVAGFGRAAHGLVDTHAAPIPGVLWSLLRTVLERTRPSGVVIERDANLPRFAALRRELRHARSIQRDVAA